MLLAGRAASAVPCAPAAAAAAGLQALLWRLFIFAAVLMLRRFCTPSVCNRVLQRLKCTATQQAQAPRCVEQPHDAARMVVLQP
jgi:hypothetical protein